MENESGKLPWQQLPWNTETQYPPTKFPAGEQLLLSNYATQQKIHLVTRDNCWNAFCKLSRNNANYFQNLKITSYLPGLLPNPDP